MSEKKGLTGSSLKIIALIAMFIDHFAAILVEGYLVKTRPQKFLTYDEFLLWTQDHRLYVTASNIYNVLRGIGRFGFPIFCFLLVEGFLHTRNVKKYIRNMFIFSLVSEIPFDLGFQKEWFYPNYQNVFFTLLLGLCAIATIKYIGEKKEKLKKLSAISDLSGVIIGIMAVYMMNESRALNVVGKPVKVFINSGSHMGTALAIGAILGILLVRVISREWEEDARGALVLQVLFVFGFIVLADLLKTDYSGYGVLTIVVMYLFRKRKEVEMALGCLALSIMSLNELCAFLMIFPVKAYNGKRGLSLKYVFYAFYPAHILLLYVVGKLTGLF